MARLACGARILSVLNNSNGVFSRDRGAVESLALKHDDGLTYLSIQGILKLADQVRQPIIIDILTVAEVLLALACYPDCSSGQK